MATQETNTEHEKRLNQALEDIKRGGDPSGRMETFLMITGLDERLETSGILPRFENPNPFDPIKEVDQHDQWWNDNPRDAEEFDKLIDKRRKTLLDLYIGSLIGRGSWPHP